MRAGAPTIQGMLEQALSRLAQQPVQIVGAGRTDSGVHAQGQVIGFDLDWRHGTEALGRAINANLPEDIVVWRLTESEPTFHPRYDARRRRYEYTIYNRPIRSPLFRLSSWHVPQPLAVDPMNQAAASIVGVHDFATFGSPAQGSSSVREVYRADWQQVGECLIFTVEANAYLKRMVRSLVGAMKLVGDSRWTVDTFAAALAARDRGWIEVVAPPQGLVLRAVTYYDDAGMN